MRRITTFIALLALFAAVSLAAGCAGAVKSAAPTEDVRAVPAGSPAMYEFFTAT